MGKIKIVIIAAAAAVVLLGAGAFTAYAKFDMFKSAKSIYLEAELKAIDQLHQTVSERIKKAKDEILSYTEETSHNRVELSEVSVKADGLDDGAADLLKLINGLKLVVDTRSNLGHNESVTELALEVEGDHFVGLEYVLEETRIGFRVKDLLDKYVVLDLESEAFKEHLGLENQPKRIVTAQEVLDALTVTEEEIRPILKAYGKIYADELKESQLAMKKDGVFKQGDTELKARELTVTFTEDEVVNLLDKWSAHMEQDEALIDLLYAKYEAITKLMKDSGEEVQVVSKAELQTKFISGIKDIRSELGDDEAAGFITFVLFIDKDDRILGRQITIRDDAHSDREGIYLETANWEASDKNEHRLIRVRTENMGDDGELTAHYTWNEEKGEGTFLLDVKSEDASLAGQPGFTLDSSFKITEKDEERLTDIDFAIRLSEAGQEQSEEVLSGSIHIVSKEDKKARSVDQTSNVSLTFSDDGNEAEISFKLRTVQTLGAEWHFPTYSDSNSIDLAALDEANLQELMFELQESVARFMEEKAGIIEKFSSVFAGLIPVGPSLYGDPYLEDFDMEGFEDFNLEDWGTLEDYPMDSFGNLEGFGDFEGLEGLEGFEGLEGLFGEDFDWEQFEADMRELEAQYQAELELYEGMFN